MWLPGRPPLTTLVLLGSASVASFDEAFGAADDDWELLVEVSCVDCHSAPRLEGGLDLAAALAAPRAHRATWERALRRVDDGEMPPEGPLEPEDHRDWVRGLVEVLGIAEEPDARPTLRRLSRAQLRNVLADLVGVEIDVERFLPRDAAGHGFDSTGDTLFVPPLYLEQLVELVEAVLERTDAAALLDDGVDEFVTRAFRRPANEREVADRVALRNAQRADGATEREAAGAVVRATLLSPSFLFRVERDAPGATEPWALSQHELATRLSFFLWGTLPDEALLRDAASGRWAEPGGLEATVDRMLASPRSRWLATDFAAQWMGFAELRDVTPDVRRYGAFNEALRRDLYREAVAFFDDLVRADRSVLEVLDSDHAFLNRRLAAHYGIAGVEHGDLRRVAVTDRTRGGVLGMGAVLTVTSTPLRTSPVQRGQWILERLLGSPAPPPPPNAGSLPEDDRQKDGLGLRARLEAHRAAPECASCHARMDPYGLALESLDGIGRKRSGGGDEPPIDTAVVLPGGTRVSGPAELKAALAERAEPFARTLAEALFTYAVGRPPELADREAIRGVVAAARADGWRYSAFVRAIVRTRAFTYRSPAR